jgi:hypothetical protein
MNPFRGSGDAGGSTEASRYLRKPKNKAEDLYHAVTDKKHGVLPWLKARW